MEYCRESNFDFTNCSIDCRPKNLALCPIHLMFEVSNIEIVVELWMLSYFLAVWMKQIQSKQIYIFVTYGLASL